MTRKYGSESQESMARNCKKIGLGIAKKCGSELQENIMGRLQFPIFAKGDIYVFIRCEPSGVSEDRVWSGFGGGCAGGFGGFAAGFGKFVRGEDGWDPGGGGVVCG
jgi:hypothetical protein